MGCGESKHAVGTADTISKSKRSSSTSDDHATKNGSETSSATAEVAVQQEENRKRDGGNVVEKGNDDGNVKQSQNGDFDEEKAVENGSEEKENGELSAENGAEVIEKSVENENKEKLENGELSAENGAEVIEKAAENESKEKENGELSAENGAEIITKEDDDDVADHGDGEKKVISSRDSPNHYISPRKDGNHEGLAIESIVPDEISGKSEYYSPRIKKVLSEEKLEVKDAEEKNESAEGAALAETKGIEGTSDVKEESQVINGGDGALPTAEAQGSENTPKGGEEKTTGK